MAAARSKRGPAAAVDMVDEPSQAASEPSQGEPDAVRHLRESVHAGADWHRAIIEAMGMWTLTEEEYEGRTFQYLVHNEAFDWLLLAERLCCELDGTVPAGEKERLLFNGALPDGVSAKDFQELLGFNKHRAYLNYWYGVVVEEALQLAVEEEVRKRHRAKGFSDSEDLVEEAFLRIYQASRTDLLTEFIAEGGDRRRKSLSLTEMKEFTYRLFKRRVKIWDPARVASDTRKGLDKLQELRAHETLPQGYGQAS